MSQPIRRIVTTHDAAGISVFDHVDLITTRLIDSRDANFALIWATKSVPAELNGSADGDFLEMGKTLKGGSVIRVVDFLPGCSSPMHRSFSIDYGIVINGELELVLDGGGVQKLTAGDIVIQRGTNHLWHNPSADQICRVIFILIEARPVVVAGRVMEEVHP
ncbi:cupin domain-containing protein [Bradyrhizobium canariense]|uniref:cupin domain-containing protein n=1 Tax=Bradyrhizobium canariense TaxID=255045 RepID=UPI001C67D486|nr:cupin domain-containing protein [Bradyrhizobium canariense]MBW5435772.1 cupin domain-containing protein [Bradyrhizobium canariense]